jgi:signal transduction histidine kinase
VTEQTKIERIHEAAKIGMDQVARLMELGRESGQHLEPVDMNELVLEIKDLLEDNLLKGVNVELNLAAARPMVQADPPLLQQSLINLLKNAREALDARSESEDGEGTIRVETEDVPGLGSSAAGTASSGILLRIMDNGIGMDATTRERLFEPLYTTKASERSSKRGLGLAMAYQTVNRLGGEIRVSSRQNAGTTFEITLPTLKEQ